MKKIIIYTLFIFSFSCSKNENIKDSNKNIDENNTEYSLKYYKKLYSEYESDTRKGVDFDYLADKYFYFPKEVLDSFPYTYSFNQGNHTTGFVKLLNNTKEPDLIYYWNTDILFTEYGSIYDTLTCESNLFIKNKEISVNTIEMNYCICFRYGKIYSVAPNYDFEEKKQNWW